MVIEKYYADWTVGEIKKLILLVGEGWDYDEIAAELKRTRDGIEKKVRRLRREYSAVNNAQLVLIAFRNKIIE